MFTTSNTAFFFPGTAGCSSRFTFQGFRCVYSCSLPRRLGAAVKTCNSWDLQTCIIAWFLNSCHTGDGKAVWDSYTSIWDLGQCRSIYAFSCSRTQHPAEYEVVSLVCTDFTMEWWLQSYMLESNSIHNFLHYTKVGSSIFAELRLICMQMLITKLYAFLQHNTTSC